ncbi:MAG: biotin--[acetyl-CoA-carboxylase] ligase [Spirochaetales bacterium]|nr:MAG: biotin--[acetyl-CoA-carboxylase] ligase [Spirochaetales bacterium]
MNVQALKIPQWDPVNRHTSLAGFERFHVQSAASTMDEARRLSHDCPFGVVSTDAQTAGRGRVAGRQWESPPGESLALTIWTPASFYGTVPPSILVGLAVRKALISWAVSAGAQFRQPLAIKWPNDILAGDAKLAGILCEAAEGVVYVGVGINLAQRHFSYEFRTKPTSLYLETAGTAPKAQELLPIVLEEISLAASRSDGWSSELNSVLAWRGKPVKFWPGLGDTACIHGMLAGIAHDGSVLIETDQGTLPFVSGELTRA